MFPNVMSMAAHMLNNGEAIQVNMICNLMINKGFMIHFIEFGNTITTQWDIVNTWDKLIFPSRYVSR